MTEYRIMWKNLRTGLIGGLGRTHPDKEFLERVVKMCEQNDEEDTSGEFLYNYWIEPAELNSLVKTML